MVSRLNKPKQMIVVLLLISCLLPSVYLQASSDPSEIQSYDREYAVSGKWIANHASGTVLSDVTAGAPVVAEGYYDVVYPTTNEGLERSYYTSNASKYSSYLEENEIDLTITSREMNNVGLFALQGPREPISKEAKDIRDEQYNKVYTNGQLSVSEY